MHSLTLLDEQRLILDIAQLTDHTEIDVIPPLCPLSVSSTDFNRLSATEWGEPLRGPDLVLPPYPTRRLHGAVELG